MKILILLLGVVFCPSWNAHDCLDDINWNACVNKCEDSMEACLSKHPDCANPNTDFNASGCDGCALTEADCVLACPNPPDSMHR